jgi:plastocyanin
MRFGRSHGVAALVVALCATACSGSSPTATTTTTPVASASPTTNPPPGVLTPPPGPTVTLHEVDFRFEPVHVVMSPDQGLTITNDGTAVHNLTIDKTSVDVDVQPGQTTNLEAIGGAVGPGTYVFFCKYHRSRGMIGAFTVVAPTSP